MKEIKAYNLWIQNASEDSDLTDELGRLNPEADKAEIHDRFYCDLEFGTGGLRGILGAGSNRMNIYTVRKATRGLASYLLKNGLAGGVAIAYDSRNKSRLFAENVAAVLCSCGIDAHLYPRLEPTPALSFAVRRLNCAAGICITASHNPAEYNGYKVYGPDGCQITAEAATKISDEISVSDPFEKINPGSGKLFIIAEDTLDAYLEAVLSQRLQKGISGSLNVVYTPLNGAGLECVTRTLQKAGYEDIKVVPEQEKPDGNFPTCPYPNPEIRKALLLGVACCEQYHADLLLATDPDCDRVGTAILHNGGYELLSGNQMGVLLFDYICETRSSNGTMPKDAIAVKTIVTTSMASKIAAHYGVTLIDVLTGFKYIGEQIGILEADGNAGRYIFGFEESYGYLSGTHVRDKDGVNASLLICDMASAYKAKGMTLVDGINTLYQRYGYYLDGLDSFTFHGEEGLFRMRRFMDSLRQNPPKIIGKWDVSKSSDFMQGIFGLPKSNVIQFTLEDMSLLTVRPSGTEPKLKVYYEVCASGRAEGEEKLRCLQKAMNDMINTDTKST